MEDFPWVGEQRVGVGAGTLVLGPSPVPQVAWAAGTIEISGPAPSRLIGTAATLPGLKGKFLHALQ